MERLIMAALATVADPELDEPITTLGFVRSVAVDPAGVTVHLRLPTSCCSPGSAYLMASDAADAVRGVPGVGTVLMLLDDHHDSDTINAGLAADGGYRAAIGVETQDHREELRRTFRRRAHTAAMERAVAALLRDSDLAVADVHLVRLGGLPAGPYKTALLRRREAIGLSTAPDASVVVDAEGRPIPAADVPMRLRFAKAARISSEGNAHFCRGLLAARPDRPARDRSA
ncbi:iron-sulfur cluster assembly protein [Cryptosporangium sp. NPDC051539]|uniref:iron-sulfur cluster assembly protein n=1 Tax=Cryptosporangium sp. NPDC051539 TaxID=3363962 RepID=UPI00379F027A